MMEEDGNLKRRILLDGRRVGEFDRVLWRSFLSDPIIALPACEEAVSEALSDVDRFPEFVKIQDKKIRVGLTGQFGANLVSPRLLSCIRVNRIVCLIGIITRTTSVRPKVLRSVHYCEAKKEYVTREYRDVTSNSGTPTGSIYPSRDEAGNLLETEYGYCTYINSHTVSMQELPELAPPGMLPRTVEIVMEEDLADSCKPGDRVYVTGILKPIIPRTQTQMKSNLRSVVVANAVTQTSANANCNLSRDDLRKIKHIAKSGTPLDTLAASFAPTIYGHETVKKGILLLMFGGAEKNLKTGTHLRGDINCLLVGDPGTAKSQLLRAVMEVCPLSISTTGRGSTGVGLTAAVTSDFDTGEKRLEAGAMVLADRGIVCIDEFDKMNDLDRVAIHEVMEQQTVTITKSGVKASLNARCSVLAAANPLYGNFDHNISVAKNVNLPDSLLSRFDMLFIVLDEKAKDHDLRISKFVLDRHVEQSADLTPKSVHTVHTWHYHHSTEHPGETGDHDQEQFLSPEFLRKYVFYAKQHMTDNIQLTEEAMKEISDYYVKLRASTSDRALPITPRTLETIIRLSTAHAKLRLSVKVERVDVDQAKAILNVVLGAQGADLMILEDVIEHKETTQDENTDLNASVDEELAPTIQSFIPAKAQSRPSASELMEVDEQEEQVTSLDALTDEMKTLIHQCIAQVLNAGACGKQEDLQKLLMETKGLNLSQECLAGYLGWISDHYQDHPELHLPQILYDKDTTEFFDVS
eukprot:g177.t1